MTDQHTTTSPLLGGDERFRRAFAQAPMGMVVLDAAATVVEANQAFADMLGRPVDELVGRLDTVHVLDEDPVQVLEWTAAGDPDVAVTDRRYRHADGRVVPARCTFRVERDDDGQVAGTLLHVTDLTRLRQAEDALATSEARFRRAFDEAPIGMTLGSQEGRLLWVNDAFCELAGRAWAEVVGRLGTDVLHPDDVALGRRLLEAGRTGGALDRPEVRLLRPDGTTVWCQVSLSLLSGGADEGPPLLLTQLVDVSAARAAEARLAHQATHDALTGLPNRTLLLDRLGQALHRRHRRGGEVVVLFLDLDDFKVVNDGLGHAAGDELLVEVAHRLRRCVRPSDTVARLGGDEFVLVCDLERAEEVAAVSGRVLGVVAQPVELGGRRIVVTGSVGVVVASGGEAPADLLRDADVAMYRSKGDGRGRATRFTEGLRAEAVARLEQEADLRHALEQGHLELHYQPIVSAGDGTVVAVEALVRWRHPDRGLLVPADFLPVAERSGLVVDLGTAVLGQACADLARWRAAGHELRVSVNLSPRQLHHEELVRTVLATCDRTGADPAGLVLELTEDALIEALGVAGAHLRDLRRHGALVALDDFGTGYSSLQYLRDLPVDMVKIDRSFVSGLGAGDDGALAEAIVGLAAALGLVSVAEGVERVDQLRRLQAMGCEMVQGYLLGRPVPLEELDLTPRR